MNRSLESASFAVNSAGEPALTLLCDCGTVTEVVVAGVQEIHGAVQEFAYTCDGCQTSHWITVAVTVNEPTEE
jgi:hypothetical protein